MLKKIDICLAGLILILAASSGRQAWSLPEIQEVVSGEAKVQVDQKTMTISASDKAIINYSSFAILNNESLVINLPSSQSSILNRDLGGAPSQILGRLECNGVFMLVNESGIRVGPNAQVSAAGLVLSTRDIRNEDFLNDTYRFKWLSEKDQDALLLNEGTIIAQNGGFAALIAGAIENRGTIAARVGKISLACGDAVRLEIAGSRLISVAVEEPVARTILDYEGKPVTDQIKNSGTLDAEGGMVIIKAKSVGSIFAKAINLDGIVRGTRAEESGGVIHIIADGEVAIGADVKATAIEIGSAQDKVLASCEAPGPRQVLIRPEASVAAEETIVIRAVELIRIESNIEAPAMALTTEGGIDTGAAAIINATTLTISANRFGAYNSALTIDSNDIHLRKLNGDISILESNGIGTTACIRGPPDTWGAISYPKNASLVLQADHVTLEGGGPASFFGNVTFYNFVCVKPWQEIYFEPGKTYTFKSTLRIEIPDEIRASVFLLSQEKSSPWYINIETPDYLLKKVVVQDSFNIREGRIYASPSNNWGNNTGWDLNSVWWTRTATTAGNWSDGSNWGGGVAPIYNDDVRFTSVGTAGSIVDRDFTIASLLIDGYTGTITQSYSLNITGDYTQTSGALSGTSASLTVGGNFSLSGANSSFSTGSLSVTGTSSIGKDVATSGNQTYTGAATLTDNVTLTGSGVAFSSTVNGAKGLTITGDASFSSTIGATTPLTSLSVSGTTTIRGNVSTTARQTYTGVATILGNYTFTGSIITFSSALDSPAAWGPIDLVISGSAVFSSTVGASGPLASLSVSGLTSIGGNITTTGAQTYTGRTTLAADATLKTTNSRIHFENTVNGTYALSLNTGTGVINFDDTVGGTYPLASLTVQSGVAQFADNTTVDIDCSVSIYSGSEVKANSSEWSVGGDWSNSGTFTYDTSTVTFDTTTSATISGNTTFYNLTCTVGGKTLTFSAGTTQTIMGTVILKGGLANRLALKSSQSGVQWHINPRGSKNISSVYVRDSYNDSKQYIDPANSQDGGNNNYWFSPPPTPNPPTPEPPEPPPPPTPEQEEGAPKGPENRADSFGKDSFRETKGREGKEERAKKEEAEAKGKKEGAEVKEKKEEAEEKGKKEERGKEEKGKEEKEKEEKGKEEKEDKGKEEKEKEEEKEEKEGKEGGGPSVKEGAAGLYSTQHYPPGKYRTVIIVFDGTVIEAPYDAEGPRFQEGVVLNIGDRGVREGTIGK